MEHSNKQLLNKHFSIPKFSPEFAELQRKHSLLEGQEWQKRSLGFNKYVIKHLNPIQTDNDIETLVD